MTHRLSRAALFFASLLLTLLSLSSCVTPATVIIVRLDSDVADDRRIELQFTVSRSGQRVGATQLFSRGVRRDEAELRFPSSLAVQPRRGDSQDGSVQLRFAVRVLGRNQREQDQTFVVDRTAQFVPGQTRAIDVFLSARCVGVRCPDGATCGAGGQCGPATVESVSFDRSTERDARVSEVSAECTPDCTGRMCGDDGCGGSCGSCADRAGAAAACSSDGTCSYACSSGRADCDLIADNGCEADLSAPATCGRCDQSCSGATPVCAMGRCASGCPGAQRLCNERCVDLSSDPQNCGACGSLCEAAPSGTARCAMGTCARGCLPGFADCDGDTSNGCEVDTRDSAEHCGRCGNGCSGATPVCNASMCASGCGVRTRCGAACADLMTSPLHCGECDARCPSGPNSVAICANARCSLRCQAGFADCDGDPSNGCEADTSTDSNHCGRCGNRCVGVGRCGGSTCVQAEQIAVRVGGACARLSNGTVECWGANSSGSLGNGTTISASSPRPVSGLGSVTDLSVFGDTACAVSAGVVHCWGRNNQGEIHGATGMTAPAPVRINTVPAATRVRVGGGFVCALTTTGEVWCWGYSADGQCGVYGSSFGYQAPTRIMLPSPATQLATGALSACALLMDRTVACWGSNSSLGLGQPSMIVRSNVPLPVPTATDVVELVAGDLHFCARRPSGPMRCWGSNSSGQLASTTLTVSTPIDVAMAGITIARVWAGGARTCMQAEASPRSVYCFGVGPLGNGSTTRSSTPLVIGQLQAARELSFASNGCQINARSEVECWGSNGSGALGDDSPTSTTVPQRIDSFSADRITSSQLNVCALTGATVSCWGSNSAGQIDPTASAARAITPISSNASLVAVGFNAIFVRATGASDPVVWTGASSTLTSSSYATGTYTMPAAIRDLSSASGQVCVVSGTGAASNVLCNTSGYLTSPPTTMIANTTGASRVIVGSAHRCALVGSEVRCWGTTTSGALGHSMPSSTAATLAAGITDAVDFAVGSDVTYVLRSTGALVAFGSNGSGQLGVGDMTARSGPVTVMMPAGVTPRRVFALGARGCLVSMAGAVYCWGGGFGALIPGTGPFYTPTLIPGITDVAELAIMLNAICARRNDRSVWCWGSNGNLGMGIDGFGFSTLPRPVLWSR